MNALTLMGTFGLATVSSLCAQAALDHVSEPRKLNDALVLHGIFSPRMISPMSTAVLMAEAAIAILGAALLVMVSTPIAILLWGIGAFAMFGGISIYSARVLSRRGRSGVSLPCGCSSGPTLLSPAITNRAIVIAVISVLTTATLLASSNRSGLMRGAMDKGEYLPIVAALLGFANAKVLWYLPDALATEAPA